ncbi:MAG: hypothetical protein QXT73_08765 [Candidatus Methanomethylicaceae archaeon]
MKRHSIAAVGLMAVLAIVLGGCGLLTKTNLETGNQSELLQPQSVGQIRQTVDDLFAEVARRVPAFGGMFLSDDEQVLQVYLTDLRPQVIAAAQAAIAAVFGVQRFQRSVMHVIQGQYSFLQLKNWYDIMAAVVLGIPGVTLTDIDDARNRLTIGVERIAIAGLVKQELSRLVSRRRWSILRKQAPLNLLATRSKAKLDL